MSLKKVRTLTYDPQYLPAFVALNREWIEKYFVIEEADRQQLQHPEKNILEKGGEIFFILEDEVAIATCAMVPHGPKAYELAKMAVSPRVHGQGYGDLLMTTALDWARSQGAGKVMLLSNTLLEPAIRLYKKHGFEVVHLGQHPDYERCNIEMAIKL